MRMITKNDYLNELLKETTAAKCPFLELFATMLAVILINVKNEMFSVNQSLYDAYAEMIETGCSENEKSCVCQRSIRAQKCTFDREMPLSVDEILAGMHRIARSN